MRASSVPEWRADEVVDSAAKRPSDFPRWPSKTMRMLLDLNNHPARAVLTCLMARAAPP